MYIQKLFAEKLEGIPRNRIAGKLGYQNPGPCTSKINKLLSSPYLGLEGGVYDFKYSTEEFIVKLAQLLDIPDLLVKKIIAEIQAELLKQAKTFRSYIYIETFFRRKEQPIFALACMSGLRIIKINKNTRSLSLDQQLPEIQSLIQNHYRNTNGELPMWGKIARYAFHHDKDLVIEFSPAGKIINVSKEYQVTLAELRIGGVPANFLGKSIGSP